ncbi:MAG: dual specificity protein phosphatase family protein [Anaerolineales bacterium]|nr:dual specificity protein phosphatase family protein [Anaerolineales bacterium]
MKKRNLTILALGAATAGLLFWLIKGNSISSLFDRLLKGLNIVVSRLREQGVPTVRLWMRDHALRRVLGLSPMDSSQVAPNLYVGGQQYRHGLDRMASLGISASLNLREEADDVQRGVALERHLWLPTQDDTPPSLEQLNQAVRFIQQAIDEERGVYIHCAAGVGRAPTAAAAYLVSTGMTPNQAWNTIRQGRPFIRPKSSQFEQIVNFHRSLQTHNNTT